MTSLETILSAVLEPRHGQPYTSNKVAEMNVTNRTFLTIAGLLALVASLAALLASWLMLALLPAGAGVLLLLLASGKRYI